MQKADVLPVRCNFSEMFSRGQTSTPFLLLCIKKPTASTRGDRQEGGPSGENLAVHWGSEPWSRQEGKSSHSASSDDRHQAAPAASECRDES